MNACATVGPLARPRAEWTDAPAVFVDGELEPALAVRSYRATAPLDLRWAELLWTTATPEPDLVGRALTVALPLRLSDDSLRWAVLLRGAILAVDEQTRVGRDEQSITVSDAWNRELSRAFTPPAGATVAQVIDAMNLALGLTALPRDVREMRLDAPATTSPHDWLAELAEQTGVIVRRRARLQSGRHLESRHLIPRHRGAAVRLPAALGDRSTTASRGARLWRAFVRGAEVESTFNMVRGWDPALQGQPDAAYSRTNNPDFAAVANVYRQWVLNEDGSFTGAPYLQGPPFDLTSLWGAAVGIAPRALRFGPCLTLDDTQRRRPAIVEVSLDAGASWAAYDGSHALLSNAAGVYLQDATLPAGFLAAAKASLARVRVTASLRSPQPVEARRWEGNAFAGVVASVELNLRDAFRVARIDAGSIHHARVRSGKLLADEADDTAALQAWLLGRMERGQTRPGTSQRSLTLCGAWPLLQIGDRLDHAANITSLRCRWDAPRRSATTTLELSH